MKERLGMTEMRKLRNRMNFGEIEDDVNQCNIGEGMGLLNAKGASSGKVRAAAVDKKTQVTPQMTNNVLTCLTMCLTMFLINLVVGSNFKSITTKAGAE